MNASPATTDKAMQAAMEWQIVLWSGEVTPEERKAFDNWLQLSAEHQSAWARVQTLEQQLTAIPHHVAGRVLRSSDRPNQQRRRVIRGLGALVTLGIVGAGVRYTPQWQTATADYKTATGEQRTITLPDGTQVMLNTATALDIDFNEESRRLLLHRGEIMVITAADSQATPRPFWVETPEGNIRPMGTRFTVYQQPQAASYPIQVQVTEGSVELLPRQGKSLYLQAGQQAGFSRAGSGKAEMANSTLSAWTRGLLIAEQQPLKDFIETLGRYHGGVLRCDPAVAHLTVSGVYPIADTGAVLQALEQALPIQIRSRFGYWTTVSAR